MNWHSLHVFKNIMDFTSAMYRTEIVLAFVMNQENRERYDARLCGLNSNSSQYPNYKKLFPYKEYRYICGSEYVRIPGETVRFPKWCTKAINSAFDSKWKDEDCLIDRCKYCSKSVPGYMFENAICRSCVWKYIALMQIIVDRFNAIKRKRITENQKIIEWTNLNKKVTHIYWKCDSKRSSKYNKHSEYHYNLECMRNYFGLTDQDLWSKLYPKSKEKPFSVIDKFIGNDMYSDVLEKGKKILSSVGCSEKDYPCVVIKSRTFNSVFSFGIPYTKIFKNVKRKNMNKPDNCLHIYSPCKPHKNWYMDVIDNICSNGFYHVGKEDRRICKHDYMYGYPAHLAGTIASKGHKLMLPGLNIADTPRKSEDQRLSDTEEATDSDRFTSIWVTLVAIVALVSCYLLLRYRRRAAAYGKLQEIELLSQNTTGSTGEGTFYIHSHQ